MTVYSLVQTSRWSWFHAGSFILLWVLMAYHFFFVADYLAQPWYQTADADAVYASQTILLLNDGDSYYFHHPGATIYGLQGGVERLLAPFSDDHRSVMRLAESDGKDGAARLLTVTVNTGRIIALISLMALGGVLYLLMLRLTGSWPVTFVFTFFFTTSKGAFHPHLFAIRPESLSLLFFCAGALMCVVALSRKTFSFYALSTALSAAGLFLGLAVFSKIQIGPEIAFLLLAISLWLWFGGSAFNTMVESRVVVANLALTLAIAAILPYWSLVKPAFLTDEVTSKLSGDYLRMYGGCLPPPGSFVPLALTVVGLLAALAVFLVLFRSRIERRRFAKLLAVSLTANLLFLGAVVAMYLPLLPVSVTLDGYFANTNHMVYATLTNLMGGGFLENKNGSLLGNIAKIHALHGVAGHGAAGLIAGVNVLHVVGLAALASAVQFVVSARGGVSSRRGAIGSTAASESGETLMVGPLSYLFPLSLFVMGFVVDLMSAMRWKVLYSHYAIYSLGYYALGLAYFVRLESRHVFHGLSAGEPGAWFRGLSKGLVGLAIFGLGLVNVGTRSYSVTTGSKRNWPPIQAGEETAWSYIKGIVPQFVSVMNYSEARSRPCLSTHSLEMDLSRISRMVGDRAAAFSLRKSSNAFRWMPSSSGGGAVGTSKDGYPVFSPASEAWSLDAYQSPAMVEDVTLNVWVKILEWPREGGAGETLLFGDRDLSIGLTVTDGGSYDKEFCGYYGGGRGGVSAPAGSAYGSIWRQVTMTKRGENLDLYIDGTRVGRARAVTQAVVSSQKPLGLNIGAGDKSATFEVASVAIWTRALSQQEVKHLYDAQVEKDGCSIDLREWLSVNGESRRDR